MLRRFAALAVAFVATCSLVLAGDASGLEGTVVKVDKAKKTLSVKTEDGVKSFSVSKETQFFGPRGGASDDGIEDSRLVAGASVRIVPQPHGRWLKEVHLLTAASARRPNSRDQAAPTDESTSATRTTRSDDKERGAPVEGKLVRVDHTRKTLTLQTEAGMRTFMTGKDTKFLGPRGGALEDGIQNERLVAGLELRILPTPAGRGAREVRMMSSTSARAGKASAGSSKDATEETVRPAPSAARVTKAPASGRPASTATEDRMDAAQSSSQGASTSSKTDKKETKTHTSAKPIDGVEGRIVAVDVDQRHITVQLKTGRKQELTVNDETQFIGPRGGVSDRGIKDDRVTPGAEVTLVFVPGGKGLKEVHLPYRNEIEKEKDK